MLARLIILLNDAELWSDSPPVPPNYLTLPHQRRPDCNFRFVTNKRRSLSVPLL